MIKNIGSHFALLLTISLLLVGAFCLNKKLNSNTSNAIALHNVQENIDNVNNEPETGLEILPAHEPVKVYTPELGKSFVAFKEALGFKESRGDYFTINDFGYLGKYQFGKETLKLIGIYNPVLFLNTPELQEKAFIANASRNKWVLRRDIKRFKGKTINGILITESGILAAAHLAGPGNVKKYLRSYGRHGFSDAFGTSIDYYLKKFSGYDTSNISPNKKAKVKLEKQTA
ncbi:peptidoglycan-binding protein LysM [Mangrovimonas cancribranchiae]|uniref:Peptidoglycan-binding protein LysM n=1 Tax=Mangrovimonas cancribranchiae TaxID=3080055 RepID=A0AAU6NZ52_9FLAO